MNAVVVVAGGSGRRMGGEIPKQFLDLAGKPLIVHTLEKFLNYDAHIQVVLVLAGSHLRLWDEICNSYDHGREFTVTTGGETRFDSVRNGLKLIEDGVLTGIHDAVRPLVSVETITRCYRAAAESGSGIPVVEVEDSIRMMTGDGVSENLERTRLRRVQTPQVFLSEQIKNAYGRAGHRDYTDDASVYESLFGRVTLVEGNRENIKITGPDDLKLASLILQ